MLRYSEGRKSPVNRGAENQSGLTQNEMCKNEWSENILISPCPETQNKMVSSSKGVKVMVCGLDHSGSQTFNQGVLISWSPD